MAGSHPQNLQLHGGSPTFSRPAGGAREVQVWVDAHLHECWASAHILHACNSYLPMPAGGEETFKGGEESGMQAYIIFIARTASHYFHIVAFPCHLQTEHEKFKGEADARVAAAAEEAMALREQLDAAQV